MAGRGWGAQWERLRRNEKVGRAVEKETVQNEKKRERESWFPSATLFHLQEDVEARESENRFK